MDALPMFVLVVLFILTPPGLFVSMGLRQPKEETERVQLHSRDQTSGANAFPMESYQNA